MKKAARLSSSLLARKGFASPAAAVPMFGKAHHYGQTSHHHIRDVVYDHVDPEQVDLDPDLAGDSAQPRHEDGDSFVRRIEKGLKSLRRAAEGDEKNDDALSPAVEPAQKARSSATKSEKTGSKKTSKTGSVPEGCCQGKPSRKRVAMTLRLDQQRHLRLRILSAHINRSSQDILTEALDRFLDQFAHMPEMRQCDCLKAQADNS
ncbi:MAG: hypothetical protein D6763_01455 [Alphaproteobacteria bacterium]|nr:MAG: hypothetical protein D6763_01455 [Alphaproteobacteria bacterium]